MKITSIKIVVVLLIIILIVIYIDTILTIYYNYNRSVTKGVENMQQESGWVGTRIFYFGIKMCYV